MQKMAQSNRNTLEELNEQFRIMQELEDRKNSKISGRSTRKSSPDRYRVVMLIRASVIILIILIIGIIVFFSGFLDKPEKSKSADSTKSIQDYSDILTEEEKKRWEEEKGEESELFVEVNTEIPVSYPSMEATLHLINPPYSRHDFKIEIYISGQPEQVLYESDRIVPGTVVEDVTFLETLETDTYPVSICYTFYKGEETIGLHVVAAELLVEDKK